MTSSSNKSDDEGVDRSVLDGRMHGARKMGDERLQVHLLEKCRHGKRHLSLGAKSGGHAHDQLTKDQIFRHKTASLRNSNIMAIDHKENDWDSIRPRTQASSFEVSSSERATYLEEDSGLSRNLEKLLLTLGASWKSGLSPRPGPSNTMPAGQKWPV